MSKLTGMIAQEMTKAMVEKGFDFSEVDARLPETYTRRQSSLDLFQALMSGNRDISIEAIAAFFEACGKPLDFAMLFPNSLRNASPHEVDEEVDGKAEKILEVAERLEDEDDQSAAKIIRAYVRYMSAQLIDTRANMLPLLEKPAVRYLAEGGGELFVLQAGSWEPVENFMVKQTEAIQFYTTQFEQMKHIIGNGADKYKIENWEDIKQYLGYAATSNVTMRIQEKEL